MKESPILFSEPMVCAILNGTKTQTRRIVDVPLFVSTQLARLDSDSARLRRLAEGNLQALKNSLEST